MPEPRAAPGGHELVLTASNAKLSARAASSVDAVREGHLAVLQNAVVDVVQQWLGL